MRPLAVVLFLIAAVPTFGALELAPPAPTDESYVVLHVREPWSNVCLPRDPQVSRNGNRIDVAFTVQFDVPVEAGEESILTYRIRIEF